MSFSISGKTAIVTGAANGIGLAIARHFLDKGANVMFADMDEVRLDDEVGEEARTEGAVRMTSDTGLSAVLAGIEVLLCVVLFVACAMHVRIRLRAAGKEAVADDAARRAATAGFASDPVSPKVKP